MRSSMAGLDRVGVVAASACGVHCMVLSALMVVMPVAAWAPAWASTEVWFVGLSAGLALAALTWGAWTHRRWEPMALSAIALIVGLWAHTMDGSGEALGSVAAGALLATAHGVNLRAHRRCRALGSNAEGANPCC